MTLPTPNGDATEILRLHHEWLASNIGLQVDRMLRVVAAGERFHHFNLNGYSYTTASEIGRLWENLPQVMRFCSLTPERDIRVEVRGDMGFVTSESDAECEILALPGSGEIQGEATRTVVPFRITEIYVRDDGTGNPEWRMWHFHCSNRLDSGPRFVTS